MKKFLLPILFLLSTLTSTALAQDANFAPMTVEQMLDYCKTKWGDHTSAVAQCVTSLRFEKSEATDAIVLARLDEGEKRDHDFLKGVDELSQKVGQLAAAQRPATQFVASQATATGVSWAFVHQPTVVSIHSLVGMVPDTLHITSLEHSTARRTCGGEGAPLVIFLDHGMPVSNVFAPAGAPTGFVEVYWDRDNNGTPDGTVMALDLSSQTDVWITWGLPNDLEIRYLRPGNRIAIERLPLQTVYHPTQRNEASASGAIGCDRDRNARRGGHQAIPAYSLSRMW